MQFLSTSLVYPKSSLLWRVQCIWFFDNYLSRKSLFTSQKSLHYVLTHHVNHDLIGIEILISRNQAISTSWRRKFCLVLFVRNLLKIAKLDSCATNFAQKKVGTSTDVILKKQLSQNYSELFYTVWLKLLEITTNSAMKRSPENVYTLSTEKLEN